MLFWIENQAKDGSTSVVLSSVLPYQAISSHHPIVKPIEERKTSRDVRFPSIERREDLRSPRPESLLRSSRNRRSNIVISSSICILHSTDPRPLATTSDRSLRSLRPLLLIIQHQTQHVETKLRELETHAPELRFRLVTQHM